MTDLVMLRLCRMLQGPCFADALFADRLFAYCVVWLVKLRAAALGQGQGLRVARGAVDGMVTGHRCGGAVVCRADFCK